MRSHRRQRTIVLLLALLVLKLFPSPMPAAGAWPADVDAAMTKAGDNRPALQAALEQVSAEQRPGLIFLIANMPKRDLETLTTDFLLENVQLAYQARREFPWAKQVPEAIFRNHVLPYANVDEARDPWRQHLYTLCRPLVKDCQTATEVAQKLNAELFRKLKVKYSTRRAKPHQSPKETIDSGLASCTGLSILLVDACRSVGVPARVVGTPRWVDVRGNHTWVEIWDGDWHFTGACEYDPKGLDRGWFVGRAKKAKKGSRRHAIFAASFQRTEQTFPLVWNRRQPMVFAEDITERYTGSEGKRSEGLSNEQTQRIREAVVDYFAASPERQASWKFDPNLDVWLAENEPAVRQLVWEAYRKSPLHSDLRADFDADRVKTPDRESPYTLKTIGKRPKQGWPLFIAMHGGGNTRPEINDRQWKIMQSYYRDHPEAGGYRYLALRAPNDTWNGFYDLPVLPLIERLIQQCLLFADIDPDRVYLMGYSHGGYGAFFIGPKLPHRFAAVHVSAAAPTDGTISPATLRNTRFTFMIGEKDTRYGRRRRCEAFAAAIAKLKGEREDIFPVVMEFQNGYGHGGLPDRDKIPEMIAYRRNPTPKQLTWDLTDPQVDDFFWLSVSKPKKGASVTAKVQGNTMELSTQDITELELHLDRRLVELDKPVQLTLNGQPRPLTLKPRLKDFCQSLHQRGDPCLAGTCMVQLHCEVTKDQP